GRPFLMPNLLTNVHLHDTRQALPGYASTSLALLDRVRTAVRPGILLVLMLGTLSVSYLVSGASTLSMRYQHAETIGRVPQPLDRNWGAWDMPQLRV
ncbi:MAG TPA: hypothetical protein PKB10_09755, partial [Tepidisphaeraceae bacterium]|nr:hypothetical protein [Tepidisphaeraceae bacterium]